MLNVSGLTTIGRVSAISVQRTKGAAPVRITRARLAAGTGTDSDVHADTLSLRQLLRADEATYRDLELRAHALRENFAAHGCLINTAVGHATAGRQ